MSRESRATAVAHPNIALAKYWGKREDGRHLPAVPSVSVTLAGMVTRTTVTFDGDLAQDELILNGAAAAATRATALLDRVRARAGMTARARVESVNDFPTAAGLASSASAFAALAVAATHAAGLVSSPREASDLARRISVSAARSVFGGFAELPAGEPGDDPEEVHAALPIAPASHWDLRVVVAVTREEAKETSSTQGMLHTQRTSPYYAAWVASAPAVAARVRAAVLARDLEALGVAAEASALAMHAAAIAAQPAIVYWNGATVEALAEVRRLRARGVVAYATIDAGPHVKVLTSAESEGEVARALGAVPGVLRTIATRPGEGARVVSDG